MYPLDLENLIFSSFLMVIAELYLAIIIRSTKAGLATMPAVAGEGSLRAPSSSMEPWWAPTDISSWWHHLSIDCYSCSIAKLLSDSSQLHGLQHTRLLCPPPLSPRVFSSSCPLSQWCYLTISSSASLFFFCLQSFPASSSFPMSHLFASGWDWHKRVL